MLILLSFLVSVRATINTDSSASLPAGHKEAAGLPDEEPADSIHDQSTFLPTQHFPTPVSPLPAHQHERPFYAFDADNVFVGQAPGFVAQQDSPHPDPRHYLIRFEDEVRKFKNRQLPAKRKTRKIRKTSPARPKSPSLRTPNISFNSASSIDALPLVADRRKKSISCIREAVSNNRDQPSGQRIDLRESILRLNYESAPLGSFNSQSDYFNSLNNSWIYDQILTKAEDRKRDSLKLDQPVKPPAAPEEPFYLRRPREPPAFPAFDPAASQLPVFAQPLSFPANPPAQSFQSQLFLQPPAETAAKPINLTVPLPSASTAPNVETNAELAPQSSPCNRPLARSSHINSDLKVSEFVGDSRVEPFVSPAQRIFLGDSATPEPGALNKPMLKLTMSEIAGSRQSFEDEKENNKKVKQNLLSFNDIKASAVPNQTSISSNTFDLVK